MDLDIYMIKCLCGLLPNTKHVWSSFIFDFKVIFCKHVKSTLLKVPQQKYRTLFENAMNL
jgi:hypothetical protein